MHDISTLKRQFLEHLEIEKGRSLRTLEVYDSYLSKFFEFTKIKNPKDITEDAIREFRINLNRKPGARYKNNVTMSKKTQNHYLIALRVFLKFLARKKIDTPVSSDGIDLAKLPDRQIDVITHEELGRLLSAPEKQKDPLTRARDKAILEMLFSTGLRVSELCSLPSSIDLSLDELSVRGKGGKIRVVFLSDDAKKYLKEYIALRKDMGEALFISFSKNNKSQKKTKEKNSGDKFNEPLNRRSVERIVKKYATIAGITERVTPHVIRHCFATDLLRNGADIRSVQALLGHSNINTTQIYTHVTDKHLRDIHKKFHSKK